ncbi:MAG: hypothetical protein HXY43_26065 [Fischerella sp.]|uniref:hypothetical protein n=1 Tax=Fischerella sp. TaxID=1191 RepID=UPI0017A366D8|nr:hypothetical protein [Fischerella sp.]NWF62604.1 hypothetical protein [Fischerella sp.]
MFSEIAIFIYYGIDWGSAGDRTLFKPQRSKGHKERQIFYRRGRRGNREVFVCNGITQVLNSDFLV